MFYYSWSKETFEGFTEKDIICIMNNCDAVGSINIGSIWLSWPFEASSGEGCGSGTEPAFCFWKVNG